MSRSFVRIHGTRYGPLEDRPATEAAVRSAADAGGEFVALLLRGHEVRVLVTRGMPVLFETIDADADVMAAGAVGVESVVFEEDEFDEWGI